MEIRLIKKTGVPRAEIEAHQQIQKEFSSTAFSKGWRGYASFAIARGGRGAGDDDFDLVLVTHTSIAVIELKNWHGRLLESDGQKWFLDGEARDTSPVLKANLNAKKLASLMKQKLGVERTPFVSAYVVMHGKVGTMKLPESEERSVLTMAEFLTFRFQDCYKNYFWGRPKFNPLDYLKDYDDFFEGPAFKPKDYLVDGFRPGTTAIFEHPKKLYSEFKATAKDDPTTFALLRQWDFSALGLELIGEKDRSFIGLREQRVYEYVADRNEELSLSLLRPVARKSPNDVTLDFSELCFLPSKVTRLTEFTHSVLPKLSPAERLTLLKALVSRFADLHDLRVAHRDVGDHCLWIDRPARVVMSGFPAAYYPEMKTVGAFREKVKVEQSTLPEDVTDDNGATPYRRDVFMLGALAYLVLYGERPPKVSGVYEWSSRANDPYDGAVTKFLQRALSREASSRFQNAREMLEALNADTANTQSSIIDISTFEAFKAASKERDYDETETLVDTEEHFCFRSDDGETAKLVKVWYGTEPDPRKPDLSLRLLSFLERARTIKGCGISGLPAVIDFGLSRRSLLLVVGWVDGTTLPDWLSRKPAYEDRVKIAKSLVETLQRLHALELAHGDIHPQNIVVKSDASPVLIDALDFHLNADDIYTTAYLPDNYKSLNPFERDRFSLAAVLTEILGTTRENARIGEFPIQRVYDEIANLLAAETLSTLDPLASALGNIGKADDEAIPEFIVTISGLAYEGVPAGELRSDNGVFHVSAQRDKRTAGSMRVWIMGIGRQISFGWNVEAETSDFVKVASVPQSQLVKSQTMRDAGIRMRINIADGPSSDLHDLAMFVLQDPQIQRRLPAELTSEISAATVADLETRPAELIDEEGRAGPAEPEVAVTELWQALLDAEEDALVTVTIAGEKRTSPYRENQLLIPYHADGGVIDYENSDTVIVESQTQEGVWKQCGQLNLRETTFGQLAELALDKPYLRANFRIGSKLRLISTQEKGSFTRRRFAVDRILQDKAVIPSLINYFERDACDRLSPTQYRAPSDEELEIYSDGDKKLNPSQKEAFRRVLGNGPISLLQGPPGTGKTWFIAALLHYLMTKERARRILLVSQAHEAVNNALEKGLELCRDKGIEFNAVRLGSESAVSDSIRHLHASSIEQSYRERFKAEQKERIVELASALGLPKGFATDFIDLHLRLGMLSERIAKLQARTGVEDEAALRSLDARVRALTETFLDVARDVYGFDEVVPPAQAVATIQMLLVDKYEVRSLEAIERLTRLIRLSAEWLRALGSPDANFAEFLAKSRTVVAGTLVGIGYRGAGVVHNIFDWVIIDEAGRAAPSELAVAMQAGHRVLLVGDHLQLPPTFSEEVKESIQERYAVDSESALFGSDFERIFDSSYGHKVGTSLLTQYRMAPNIGELVSECFYDGKLEPGRGGPPEYYDLLPEHLSKEVTWIDTSTLGRRGEEQSSDDNKNKWNDTEARVVMELLRQIIESDEFMTFLEEDLQPQEPPIGIICMYSKQRALIDRLKSEATWLGEARKLVKVDTVDSYQGKENRIIILSTVRNNPKGNPGFLWSPNRINVAMSRAMERLYIVGATKMWKAKNASLPLGRVLTKVDSMVNADRASLLPADQFLGN
ncbi:MAG: AAA domain-containing protein [Rhodocyclaceae bacterium]